MSSRVGRGGAEERAMRGSQQTVCFTCGQPAGDFPRLNCLPGGQVCPTCRDRLLESLAPCLPSDYEVEQAGPATPIESESEEEEEEEEEEGTVPLRAHKGPRQGLGREEPDQPA